MPGYFELDGYIELAEDGMTAKVVGVLRRKTLPLKVQNLRAVEVDDTFVSLAWDGGGNAFAWKLYRDDVLLDTLSALTYLDEDVDPDTDYVYHVIGVNSRGDGVASDDLPVHTETLEAPDAPTNLAFVDIDPLSAGHAEFSWDDPGNVAEWEVYRGVALIATVTSPTYRDGTLAPDTTYSFTVKAVNASGTSAASSAFEVTTDPNALPLWEDFELSGTVGDAFSLDLRLQCSDPDGHTLSFSIVSGSVPGLSIVGTSLAGSLTTDGEHTVTLRANDGFDDSDFVLTFTVAALVDTTAPTVPANVTTVVNGSTTTTTWDASTDASGILQYQVQRNGQFRGNTTEREWIETGLPNGDYTYAIKARDASANQNVSLEGTGNLVTVAVAPPNPDTPVYNPPSVVSSSQINHSWAAGPSGPTPTGYELDRSPTGADTWTNVFSGLATSFNDTGLTSSTTYDYRLRALNGAAPSGYATRTATTAGTGPSGYQFPFATTPSSETLDAVATFHCIGLYWDETGTVVSAKLPPNSDAHSALVRFKKSSESTWRKGHPMMWDDRNASAALDSVTPISVVRTTPIGIGSKQHRSSLVGLEPGTSYDIEVATPATGKIASTTISTWSEVFPEHASVNTVADRTTTLTISAAQSGTAGAYKVWQPAGWVPGMPNIVIDGNLAIDYGIRFTTGAHHIIVRGITVREVRRACFAFDPDCQDIVIERCEGTKYGRPDSEQPQFGQNDIGGVGTIQEANNTTNQNVKRIVVQNCHFHDPQYDSNTWLENRTSLDTFHPANAGVTYFTNTGGNMVFRYNTIDCADFVRMFDDCVSGQANFSFSGDLFRDSDVYGNKVSHCWDDAIQLEGAGMNCRIFENYTEYARLMISCATNSIGPIYVFRNVGTRGIRTTDNNPVGDFFKTYGKGKVGTNWKHSDGTLDQLTYGGGRVYLYHNTVFKSATAIHGNGMINNIFNADQLGLTWVTSLNNIWDSRNSLSSAHVGHINTTINGVAPRSYFDFDLVGAGHNSWSNVEPNCIVANPAFVSGAEVATFGPHALTNASPGRNEAIVIPGFNDQYSTPDIGAQERGGPKLQFGVRPV